jgi:hypothetical protein
MTFGKFESSVTQALQETKEHADREAALVAVNDNGLRLLEWFRGLPPEKKIAVFNSVTAAAAKARH